MFGKFNNHLDKIRAQNEQNEDDRFNEFHLLMVEGLLPISGRQPNLDTSRYDNDPPQTLVEMLVESKLLNYCSELLRNDSLEDATKRWGLYRALGGLLHKLGSHNATASHTIYNGLPLREGNRLSLTFERDPKESKGKSSSLFSCLGNLNVQSRLVLQKSMGKEREFQTQDGQTLLLVCRGISDLHEHLAGNPTMSNTNMATERETGVPSLIELPDDQIMADHAHAENAMLLRFVEPGRFRHVMTQLSTLKTSLPPGIFVRHAESRPDVHKILMIGPAGTPYKNGIFEFDLFCPAEFPKTPPLVQFRTTGGGRIAFNPNLYADGTVCLSLIGTWEGIAQATMYNERVRQNTLCTAILPWLENTPALWKDVIDQHFKTNANKILRAAVEWSKGKLNPTS
ncbi:ubiquitin-conjugating enzyme/RWD-like protein [Phaeosphaeriaceae sp. PMI808]|nr:ubiquitin-conjugating enzyme/RWD-like protein [Phaeosphaeriaceae sp. PMI808]